MSNTLASDLLFIIIVLLIAAILGFLVGYFMRRPKAAASDILKETGEGTREDEIPSFDAKTAGAILGKYIAANDLKIVKGIGPVIEGILKSNNVNTWKKLSENDPEHISTLLINEGGERYRVHDPETWPKQAELAFNGNWEELKNLQHEIVHGHMR